MPSQCQRLLTLVLSIIWSRCSREVERASECVHCDHGLACEIPCEVSIVSLNSRSTRRHYPRRAMHHLRRIQQVAGNLPGIPIGYVTVT